MELSTGTKNLKLVLNFRHQPLPRPNRASNFTIQDFYSVCWASLAGWRAPQVCVRTRDPGNARSSAKGSFCQPLLGRTASASRRGRQHFHKGKRREPKGQGQDDVEAGPAGSDYSPPRKQLRGGQFPGARSGSGWGSRKRRGSGPMGSPVEKRPPGPARPDGG